MKSTRRTGHTSPRRAFIVVTLATFGLSALWALAGPTFSIPDEDAHALKGVALMQGQLTGESREGVKHPVVDLPEGFEYTPAILCFATNPDASAACAVPLGTAGGTDWFGNWVATYNPFYYVLVSWPSLLMTGEPAIMAMRFVSAAVNSLVMGLAAAAAFSSRARSWSPYAVTLMALPMVVYFAGSVNPQSLEISGAFLLWWAGLRLVESGREGFEPRVGVLSGHSAWALVALGAALVSNARATGPLWVLIVAAGCATLAGWRPAGALFARRSSWPWLAAVAVPAVLSVLWTFNTGSLANQAEPTDAPLVGASAASGAAWMLYYTPTYLQQFAGVFGWLDTVLPWPVYMLLVLGLVVPLLMALSVLTKGPLLRLGIVAVAAAAVPVVIQSISVSQTGIIWQGRYGAFLYLGLVIAACWSLDQRSTEPTGLEPRLPVLLTWLLSLYGILAFVIVLSRYVTGLDGSLLDMILRPEWQPPLGVVTVVLLYVLIQLGFTLWVRRESRLPLEA